MSETYTFSDNSAYPDGWIPLQVYGTVLKCPFCDFIVPTDTSAGEVVQHDCPYVPEGWERV